MGQIPDNLYEYEQHEAEMERRERMRRREAYAWDVAERCFGGCGTHTWNYGEGDGWE